MSPALHGQKNFPRLVLTSQARACANSRKPKQQRRRRQHHSKSEVALLQTLSRLFDLI